MKPRAASTRSNTHSAAVSRGKASRFPAAAVASSFIVAPLGMENLNHQVTESAAPRKVRAPQREQHAQIAYLNIRIVTVHLKSKK